MSMSEVAKDRLVVLGTRFASYEHENASKKKSKIKPTTNESTLSSPINVPNRQTGSGSFWKKSTNKVPGRPVYGAQHPPLHAIDAHLATYIKSNRVNKLKTGTSFQEFEGSTLDAWDDGEDDGIEHVDTSLVESIHRPTLERVSSDENERHSKVEDTKLSKATTLKQKISNTLSKVNRVKSTSPPTHDAIAMNFAQPPIPHSPMRGENLEGLKDQENARLEKFGKLLAGPTTDLDVLRKLSWNGIPKDVRAITWRLLSGYIPPNIDRRQATLLRKQTEYHNFVQQYYPTRHDHLHQETFRQIHIDIPRTNPLIPIFQQKVVQEIFERILFIWSIRHPASGYVQGINDLVVPFFVVFLSEHVEKQVETYNINHVKKDVLDMVEADSFWCFSKLLDGIQDNYTFAQPGIQMKVNALKNLVSRIDAPLNDHIFSHNIEFLQFTFRWMNNLLMRELPLRASIRLWDTYWSETDGFAMFHLYVCAAFLTRFSDEIKRKTEFQHVMVMLQNLPCKDWGDDEISCLVAEAFRLQFVFADAPKHIGRKY